MAKPTNHFAAVLKQQPIPTQAKVHLYLLHIATKKEEGWFAMVKSRTIGEALDIDSNREVQKALASIGATEGTSTFKNRTVPGYFIPNSNQTEGTGRNTTSEGKAGSEGISGPDGAVGIDGTKGVKEHKEHKESAPSSQLGAQGASGAANGASPSEPSEPGATDYVLVPSRVPPAAFPLLNLLTQNGGYMSRAGIARKSGMTLEDVDEVLAIPRTERQCFRETLSGEVYYSRNSLTPEQTLQILEGLMHVQ